MRRHYGQTRHAKQAEWLARFSDLLLTRAPALSGRIDWPAALHYYHAGAAPQDVVDQYCIARSIV